MADQEIIQQQKQIAQKWLRRLKILDNHSLLAGGAPRNWMIGREANDLDFFLLNTHSLSIQCLVEEFGIELEDITADPEVLAMYETRGRVGAHNPIVQVKQFRDEGQLIQLIFLDQSPSRYAGRFPCYNSRVMCGDTRNIESISCNSSTRALNNSQTLKFTWDCPARYMTKMVSQFPDWQVQVQEKPDETTFGGISRSRMDGFVDAMQRTTIYAPTENSPDNNF